MSRITIALKVTDFEFGHEQLTDVLGLTPTNSYFKGQEYEIGPVHNRIKKLYKSNYWEYRISINENNAWVSNVISQFVKEIIEIRSDALNELKNKCQFEIFIGLLYDEGERLESFHFNIEILQLLSRLNIEIDIDQQLV